MCPPTSSLAPPASTSIAPASTGPTLRPRTPTRPRPGFVPLSPDLRVSCVRPSPVPDSAESDNQDIYKVTSGQSETSDGIGSQEGIEIESDGPDKSTVPDPSKRKKTTHKLRPKVHVVKSRGRPRGSGASITLTRPPSKKSRKGRLEVSLIMFSSQLQSLTLVFE